MSSTDDPRDKNLEVKLTLPKTWSTGGTDAFSALSMLLAGAVMVTRNRYLAWPALLMGISAFINFKAVSTKDSGTSWQSLISGVSALFLAYMPMILVGKPANAPSQVPLPTVT